MMRWLRSKSLMLALGSALASGFNFYSFVFLPALSGVGNLEEFVRDNYLGGLYLFGIASSVAPFSIYIFARGKSLALQRYSALSLMGLILIGIAGIGVANVPWSYACLAAAFCMHGAGLFLAGLIQQERIILASGLQIIQPALFAGLLSLHALGFLSGLNWTLLYSLSCFACLISFTAFADWKWLATTLKEASTEYPNWPSILARVMLSGSFPLFFQLELILAGNFSHANLGEYAMVQKLYASVSIALFSTVGMRMVIASPTGNGILLNKKVILMALSCTIFVFLIGSGIYILGKSHGVSMKLIFFSSIVAFFYTLSSFLGLAMNSGNPRLAFKSFICAVAAYSICYSIIQPKNSFDFLELAGLLFFAHITACYLMYPRNISN